MSGVETGIVAALPEEVEEILSRLEAEVPSEAGRGGDRLPVLRRGILGGHSVAVAVTGDGRRNALRGGRAFLDAVPMERLLVVGVAGSLVEELEACSVLAGRVVWREGEGVVSRVDDSGEERFLEVSRSGVVATVDRILDTPEAKRAVAERLARDGLEGEPAVADLESAFYARLARERGIPCFVLRAVSDEARESLPSFLNRCRDEGGAVERSKVVRHLFRRPTQVSVLLKLRRRVRCCADRLADIVERLLRREAP